MKAEWNDAPDYIRRRPRKGAVAWLIPGLIGTAIMLAALQMASSSFLKGTAHGIADKRTQSKPAPVAEIKRVEPAAIKDWDKVVRNVADRSEHVIYSTSQREGDTPPASGRQTVFNDSNYIPQGANNVMPAISTYQSIEFAAPKKKQELVIVGKEARLRDLCPYREGSIERRNCKMRVDLNR